MKVKELLHEKIFIDPRIKVVYIYNDTFKDGYFINGVTYEIIQRETYYGIEHENIKLEEIKTKKGDTPTFNDVLENYITLYKIRSNEAHIFSGNTNKEEDIK